MITIVLIKNPFQPIEGREVHQIPYEPGKKVSDYSEAFLTEYGGEFTVRSKTYVVDDTYIPQDGDFIVISPVIGRHKNPLVIVAAIALSVVSMGIGANVAGMGFFGSLAGASGWAAIGGYLAAAAVMALGGSLIQRAFGTADLNNSTTSDPTYSWSGVSTTTGQGYAIPITYGTVRSGGQILSEYVLNDGNKQYLYRLYSAGQGPLTISDIQLNDNPVGQYEKVYIDTRSGTNDQDIISNFSDTISEKALAYELVEDTWRSDVVTGTATEGIIVSLEASNGLYYTNDNGSLSQAWDEVAIQYRPYGSTSDDDWVSLLSNQFKVESTTLSGIDISLFSQQGISAGTYDIYVKANPFFGITAKIGDWEAHADGSSVSCGPFTVKKTSISLEGTGTVTIVAGNVIDSVKIYGSQTSAVRQDFRLDNLPAGQYEVRAKVLSRSSAVDLARASVRIWWTALAGVVYDDFCYPGIALIGMKGLATDQLSGSPTMKFLKTRDTVEVWNPNTGEYEGKDATNPSWASYDFIHQAYKEKRINPDTGDFTYPTPTFARASIAYDNDGNQVAANVPRFTDDGLMVEKGITNLYNAIAQKSLNNCTKQDIDGIYGCAGMRLTGTVANTSVGLYVYTNTYTTTLTVTMYVRIVSGWNAKAYFVLLRERANISARSTSTTVGDIQKLRITYAETGGGGALCLYAYNTDVGACFDILAYQIEENAYGTSVTPTTRDAESLSLIDQSIFPDQNHWKIEFDYDQAVFSGRNFFQFDVYSHLWLLSNGIQLVLYHPASDRTVKTIYPSFGGISGAKHRIVLIKKSGKIYDMWIDAEKVLSDFADTDVANTTDRLIINSLASAASVSNIRVSTGTWTDDKMIADAQLGRLQVESDTTYYLPLKDDIQPDMRMIDVRGASKDLMMYDRFKDWADFCDLHDLKINLEVNTAGELLEILNKDIAPIGHGCVTLYGTKYGPVWDAPGEAVQMFGMGNIIAGSFEEDFLQTSDRANAVEVTFTNKDKNYERDTVTVYSSDYDSSYNRTTEVTMNGITDYQRAYKYGMFLLKCNERQIRTCTFKAEIDAIACTVGDIVLISHDIPYWATSGRISEVNGNTVKMNAIMDNYDSSAQYQITYRASSNDTIYTVNCSVSYNSNVISAILSSTPGTAPSVGDVCSISKVSIGNKPFVIKSITRDTDMIRQISAIEYDEAVFAEDYDIPEIEYSTSSVTTAVNVENLSGSQIQWKTSDGVKHARMDLSWELPVNAFADRFAVYLSLDGGSSWNYSGETAGMNYTIETTPETDYTVMVKSVRGVSISSGVSIAVNKGADTVPSDITGLSVSQVSSNSTQAKLTWNIASDIDLRGYRVYVNGAVESDILTDNTYVFTAKSSGIYTFSVVSIDNSWNESANSASYPITITCEPSDVTGFTKSADINNRATAIFFWDANHEVDLSYYEIRTGDSWDAGTVIVTKTKATKVNYTLPDSGSHTYWIKAVNAEGFYSVNASQLVVQVNLIPDAVSNISVVQSSKDKSKATISFTPSNGSDIAKYTIKYGSEWSSGEIILETKETSIEWQIPQSGTFNIMVQATTVAGYVSAVANYSFTVSIMPLDVTNFTSTQSSTDRTVIRLSWDPPSETDVSYYVIKEGTSWDTAVLKSPRVQGTFFDVEIFDELPHTWLVKAVSIVGNESQYPAQTKGVYSMIPSKVPSIQAAQDITDSSNLIINWDGIDDGDKAGYQVKIGTDWDSGEPLPLTQELYENYTLKSSGTFHIMIKALNNAGYYSDETSIDIDAKVEPDDVNGLIAFQNGDTVQLYWDKSDNADVTGYEVREGYSWGSGVLIATGISNTNYTVDVDTARYYHYFVKAINGSGYYSSNPASVPITITDLSKRNVIDSYDEISLADGTHTHTEFGTSNLNFQTMGGKFSDYTNTKFSEVGGTSVLKLAQSSSGVYYSSGTYTTKVIDVSSVITCNVTVLFTSSANLKGGSAELQVRMSQDNSTWTDWEVFKPVQRTFRYIQFQVILTTEDTAKNVEVNQMKISIDVPDTDIQNIVSISQGGTTVSYGHTFYTNPSVVATALGEGLHTELVSVGVSSCVVKIKNTSNTDIGGTANIHIRGY